MIIDPQLPLDFKSQAFKQENSNRFNLQAITVWIKPSKIIIQANYKKQISNNIIEIDRAKKTMIEKNNQLTDLQQAKPTYFSLFIGILDLNGVKIIVLVQEAQFICTINYRDIFKIIKPIFLFFDPQQKAKLSEQNAKLLINITAILQQGMFFSFSYDLTMYLNSSQVIPQRRQEYNWAHSMQNCLIDFDKYWSIPIIQGFVNKIQIHLNGQKFTIKLISRRSTKRSGTQNYARGIDQNGNAILYKLSKYCQLINFHSLFSKLEELCPYFWDVDVSYGGMFKTINMQRTFQQNFEAFTKHINILKQQTKVDQIYILNLLSIKKAHEKKLIQNYETVVNKKMQQNEIGCQIKYAHFDIHDRCPNKQYSEINKFLQQKFIVAIQRCQFNAIKMVQKNKYEVINNQKGVIRTNCLSCIDRSNIAQFRLATLSMIYCLRHLHIMQAKQKLNVIKGLERKDMNFFYQKRQNTSDNFENGFINSLKFLTDINNPFTQLYRNLWADNGDYLSKQFTGTGSTQSFAVRKGKLSYLTSIDHGMKSIERAMRNIRNQDKEKNDAIDCILGRLKY